MSIKLDTEIQYIKGAGPKVSKLLNRLNLYTVKDCIYFFPREYDDRRSLPKIVDLKTGEIKTIFVQVLSVNEKKVKKGLSVVEAVIQDSTGKMIAIWFNQKYLLPVLVPGIKLIIKGKIERSLFYQTSQIHVQSTEIIRSNKELLSKYEGSKNSNSEGTPP